MLLTTGQGMGPQFKIQNVGNSIPELDITGMTYQSVTADITANTNRGFCINSDGTKLYLIDFTNLQIIEYSFGTVDDITTLTATGNTLDLSATFTQLYDACLSSDDKEMYVIGPTADVVRQYSMTTASDLSTASYSGNELNLQTAMGVTVQGKGIAIVDGDTKLYVTNDVDETIHRYDLSTAKDLSTTTHAQQSAATARGFTMYVNEAGTKILIDSVAENIVYQYSLSAPYDLSTMTQDTTVDASATVSTLWDMWPSTDNSKLFICDNAGNFYEFA